MLLVGLPTTMTLNGNLSLPAGLVLTGDVGRCLVVRLVVVIGVGGSGGGDQGRDCQDSVFHGLLLVVKSVERGCCDQDFGLAAKLRNVPVAVTLMVTGALVRLRQYHPCIPSNGAWNSPFSPADEPFS